MERKTKINAQDGRHDIEIIREFDLPVELLFKAHTEPEIVEQWMGTKVISLENRKHGTWHFETADGNGNVVLRMTGVFHEFIPNQKITRTLEMLDTPFDVRLEFLSFEKIADETSQLTMHLIFRSAELRDQMLQLPFAQGLNMAHNRLQEVLNKLK